MLEFSHPRGAVVFPESAHSSEMSDSEPAGVRLAHYSSAALPSNWWPTKQVP